MPNHSSLAYLFFALTLGAGGFLSAAVLLRYAPGRNLTDSMLASVFWPALLVQIAVCVAAQAMTVNTLGEFVRRQTWDQIRVSGRGVELTFRMKRLSVFHRLRKILVMLAAVRVMLIIGALVDLVTQRLDILMSGISPQIPVAGGAVLLACVMAASFILPVTGIGLDAAVGLFISTVFDHRVYTAVAQVALAVGRVVAVVVLLIGITQFNRGEPAISGGIAFLLAALFAGAGDWGLLLLNLDFSTEMWAAIPNGVFLGAALLAVAFIQALASDRILAFAVRRIEGGG